MTSYTVHFAKTGYLTLTNQNPMSAAYLTVGTSITAVNLYAGTNVNAANIANIANLAAGNIPVADITNAATTVGSSIGGNIPTAAMTNHVGAAIIAAPQFNAPLADLTNALATVGASYTNAQTGFTNIFSGTGILISHTP
jgi:hypothetical protein